MTILAKDEQAERLDTYLSNATPFGFSGALLYAREGRILLNKGYGYANREARILNTAQTAFDTGSINKPFTAIAIMQLEERGLLSTEDSISKYFADVPADKQAISIFHLLTHTAGIVDFIAEDDFDQTSREDTEKRLLQEERTHPVGEEYTYSNGGFGLLGMIVEKVSGQSYPEYLRQHIFQPAEMDQTGWYGERIWSEEYVAHGYVDGRNAGTPYHWETPQWQLLAQGGLVQTVEDLFLAHEALKNNVLLSAAAQEKMYTPFIRDALGWHIVDSPYGKLIQHDGASDYGFNASWRRYVDQDVVIVIACNTMDDNNMMAMIVQEKIARIAFGEDFSMPPETQSIALDPARFVGHYQVDNLALHIEAQDDHLLLIPDGDPMLDWFFPAEEKQTINQHMRTIAASILQGDYVHFKTQLADPDRINVYPELIQEFAGELGELQALDYLGTRELRHYLIAHLRLTFEQGTRILRLAWLNGKIIGRVPICEDVERLFEFTILPHSATILAGYDISSGCKFEVSLEDDQRLHLRTFDKSLILTRS